MTANMQGAIKVNVSMQSSKPFDPKEKSLEPLANSANENPPPIAVNPNTGGGSVME